MIDLQFSPTLWEYLDDFYDEEWEAYLRPFPQDGFDWQYVVFYQDKCISCPVLWTANISVSITGFRLKLTTGHTFETITEMTPIKMQSGDTLSLDQFIVPRNNNEDGY